jgi:hypothetical protein
MSHGAGMQRDKSPGLEKFSPLRDPRSRSSETFALAADLPMPTTGGNTTRPPEDDPPDLSKPLTVTAIVVSP